MAKSWLSKCSQNFQDFYKWSEKYIEKYGKSVEIVNVRHLTEGGKHAGECDGDKITVALKCPLFEETYVHEFAHLTQSVEQIPVWKHLDKFQNAYFRLEDGSVDIIDYPNLLKIIELELDCERRVMKLSKKWGLFDNELYAQRANVYMYYYQFIFLKKRWINTTTIYKPGIVESMPKKLLKLKDFQTIDMEKMKLFDRLLKETK